MTATRRFKDELLRASQPLERGNKTVVRRPRTNEGGREEEENRPEIPALLPNRTTGNR